MVTSCPAFSSEDPRNARPKGGRESFTRRKGSNDGEGRGLIRKILKRRTPYPIAPGTF